MTAFVLPQGSPALNELLAELDARPRTKLFGLSQGQVLRGMRGGLAKTGARAVGLSGLERHLLSAHREELATVLQQQAVARMGQVGDLGGFCSNWTRTEGPVDVTPVDEARVKNVKEIPREVKEGMPGEGGLAAFCSSGTAEQLAYWACQVLPTPHRLVILATTQILGRSYQAGLHGLANVLRGPCSSTTRRCAQQNVALGLWRIGKLSAALELIQDATKGSAAPPSMWFDRLAYAVRSGDAMEVARAAEGLSEVVDARHAALDDAIRITKALLRSEYGVVQPETADFAKGQAGLLPGPAERYLEETFCSQPEAGKAQ